LRTIEFGGLNKLPTKQHAHTITVHIGRYHVNLAISIQIPDCEMPRAPTREIRRALCLRESASAIANQNQHRSAGSRNDIRFAIVIHVSQGQLEKIAAKIKR
jgi:hypothetical protein